MQRLLVEVYRTHRRRWTRAATDHAQPRPPTPADPSSSAHLVRAALLARSARRQQGPRSSLGGTFPASRAMDDRAGPAAAARGHPCLLRRGERPRGDHWVRRALAKRLVRHWLPRSQIASRCLHYPRSYSEEQGRLAPLIRHAADRSGVLALGSTPLTFLLAARNSPITWLTGADFGTVQVYHRWVARVTYGNATVHSASCRGALPHVTSMSSH